MAFKEGDKKPEKSGRSPGTKNRLTTTVKETFLAVFNNLQEDPDAPYALRRWGEKYPHLFYPLAARLIPTEISAQVQTTKIEVVRKDTANRTGDAPSGSETNPE